MLRTGWYRLSTSWRRWAGGYVALVLVVGLGGGLALGSVAAARRTASSFSVFLASTNPSDVTIEPAGGGAIDLAKDRQLTEAIARFPHVRHVESYVAMGANFTVGSRTFSDNGGSVVLVGSVDGLLFDQDQLTVTEGRRANPDDPHEVMMTETAAQVLGLHVDQSFVLSLAPARASAPPLRYPVTVVGIGELNRNVVQDQIEQFPTYVIATPALTRAHQTGSQLAYFGVQLDDGVAGVPQLEREWNSTERYFTDFAVSSQTTQKADESIRPEALALGAFGCIAGLTVLLIAIEELARQRRARDTEREIMRSLGASPAVTTSDGLIGTLAAIVLGALLAAGVAVALSPLSPIGPARSVYPDRGFAADWTVLAFGGLALVVVLAAIAVAGSALSAPHHHRAAAGRLGRRSVVADALGRSGLPASSAIGARFALDAGRSRNATPVRWVLVGAITALLVVSATLTFGASLQSLVSHPSLYGWNWDEAVQGSDGYGPVPQSTVQAVLRHEPGVAESGVWYTTFEFDGVEVPALLAYPGADVAPPILSGHGLAGKNQVVLGAATLSELHKHVGDTISMRYGPTLPPTPIRLTIVGVATMPAIGIAEGLHTSMGIGALVPADNGRLTEMFGPQGYPGCNGPNIVFLRADNGDAATAQRAAQRLAATASAVLANEPANSPTCGGNVATVLAVQRPAQIVNYRSMGLTPLLLAVALAAGATVALGLTLVASVRRRRRELAILKALGFTPGQLQASVLWQAGIVAVVGVFVGVPLGVALGRWLWTLFADEIGAVPAPAVPVWSLALASLVALALAVVLSAVPGRIAARTPAVTTLNAD